MPLPALTILATLCLWPKRRAGLHHPPLGLASLHSLDAGRRPLSHRYGQAPHLVRRHLGCPLCPVRRRLSVMTALHMIAANSMVDLAEWLVGSCNYLQAYRYDQGHMKWTRREGERGMLGGWLGGCDSKPSFPGDTAWRSQSPVSVARGNFSTTSRWHWVPKPGR